MGITVKPVPFWSGPSPEARVPASLCVSRSCRRVPMWRFSKTTMREQRRWLSRAWPSTKNWATHGIADCYGLFAELAMRRGKLTEAIALTEEQVRLMRQVGEPGQIAQSLSKLAEMLNRRGELARVPALYEEALLLFRKAGNDLGVAATLIESATGLYWFSLADAATIQTVRHRLQEAQAIVTRLGSRYWIAYCSWLGALLALGEGEMARAESLAQESLAIDQEIGDRCDAAFALHLLGR